MHRRINNDRKGCSLAKESFSAAGKIVLHKTENHCHDVAFFEVFSAHVDDITIFSKKKTDKRFCGNRYTDTYTNFGTHLHWVICKSQFKLKLNIFKRATARCLNDWSVVVATTLGGGIGGR
jgi:hypothetical protein